MIREGTSNVISNNIFTNDSIMLYYIDVDNFLTYQITSTNKINGKPLLLYINAQNQRLEDIEAGEIIIVNSTNVLIANVKAGIIELYASSNITIMNSEFGNIDYEILVWEDSSDIKIKNNVIKNNEINNITMRGEKYSCRE